MCPDQPKVCCYCGEPIRISREACGFKTMEPKQSWHMSCLPLLPQNRIAH